MGSGRIERNERSKRLAIVPSLVISDHSAVSIYFLFFPFFTFRLSWRHQRFRFYSRQNERRKGEDWRSLLREIYLRFHAIGLEINCDLIKEFGQYLEGKKKRTGAPATE